MVKKRIVIEFDVLEEDESKIKDFVANITWSVSNFQSHGSFAPRVKITLEAQECKWSYVDDYNRNFNS